MGSSYARAGLPRRFLCHLPSRRCGSLYSAVCDTGVSRVEARLVESRDGDSVSRLEDAVSLEYFGERKEPCGDCAEVQGKMYCTMNCGPRIPAPTQIPVELFKSCNRPLGIVATSATNGNHAMSQPKALWSGNGRLFAWRRTVSGDSARWLPAIPFAIRGWT